MSYITANGTETARAIAYAETKVSDAKSDPLLRDAERLVRDIAPPPDPVPTEYRVDALDAELRTFSWLCAGGDGTVKSETSDGQTVTYSDKAEPVYDLIARLMNRWIKGAPPRPAVSKNAFSNVLTEKDKW